MLVKNHDWSISMTFGSSILVEDRTLSIILVGAWNYLWIFNKTHAYLPFL